MDAGEQAGGVADEEEDGVLVRIVVMEGGAAVIEEPGAFGTVDEFVPAEDGLEDGGREAVLLEEVEQIMRVFGEAGSTEAASPVVAGHGEMGSTDAGIESDEGGDLFVADAKGYAEIKELIAEGDLGGEEDVLEELDHLGLGIANKVETIGQDLAVMMGGLEEADHAILEDDREGVIEETEDPVGGGAKVLCPIELGEEFGHKVAVVLVAETGGDGAADDAEGILEAG